MKQDLPPISESASGEQFRTPASISLRSWPDDDRVEALSAMRNRPPPRRSVPRTWLVSIELLNARICACHF